jgi:hypothetical protein
MRCLKENFKFDSITRDKNAAYNIARVGYEIILKNNRP